MRSDVHIAHSMKSLEVSISTLSILLVLLRPVRILLQPTLWYMSLRVSPGGEQVA